MSNIASLVRASALSLVFIAAIPAWPAPPQLLPPDEVAALLEKSETKADHLKLAEHFAAEAARFQTAAKHHEALAKTYGRRNLPPRFRVQNRGMANHCRNLVRSLHSAAKASEDLAKSHRAMAAEVEK